MSRLNNKPQIWRLAVDLGLGASNRPVSEILRLVIGRVRKIANRYGCETLNDLVAATAADVGTIFEEIHSNEDLERVQRAYLRQNETGFANLQNELGARDYAITLKRLNPAKWDRPYVSVIDCRGDKLLRAYFSRWHELAHLLTLTQQRRLVFRRTHDRALVDAEEALMDVVAGEAGFLTDFLGINCTQGISFEGIERIRSEFCPEASRQAALIGIVKALPQACILLEAKMGLRRHQQPNEAQLTLGLPQSSRAMPTLRAIHVTVNRAARNAGIFLPQNWRVPAESVIRRVFQDGGYAEAIEDLSWWSTSDGTRLPDCQVTVKAKKSGDSVVALLIPV